MRKLKNVLAAAAAAAICISSSSAAYAAVNTDIAPSAPLCTDTFNLSYNADAPRFATVDEAAAYLKQQLKQRNADFDLIVTGWTPDDDDDGDDITDKIKEKIMMMTDDPTEGVYLAFTCQLTEGALYVTDGAYVKYSVEYFTTTEQEEEVTAAVAKMKASPEFAAAKSSDIYDRILWAYDQVIANMKLTDDLTSTEQSTAYSAVVKKEANEMGQIHFLIRLLQEMGVQPMIYMSNLTSLTNDNLDCHFLCYAMIDDKMYFLDPIWDQKMGGNKHRFFLKGYSDLDSENEGKEEFTHIHIFQIFNISAEEAMKDSQVSEKAYVRPAPVNVSDGDINGDSEINAVDASLILREYAMLSGGTHTGSFSEAQTKAADIDGNGLIDAVDASRVLSYYAYVSTIGEGTLPESIKNYTRK